MTKENSNNDIALEISQKFEFYFLALVFTILGLSIQTTSFTNIKIQCYSELLGWAALVLSGLAGLSRLEWIPIAYRQHDALLKEKKELDTINKGLKGTTLLTLDQTPWTNKGLNIRKTKIETRTKKRHEILKGLEKNVLIKYEIHKWGFVVGIILLLVSRGIMGLN